MTHLDRAAALAAACGDEQLLSEIAGLFQDEAPRLLAGLRCALGNHEAKSVEQNAHALKGLVLNFGAGECAQTAQRIETHARSGDLSEAPADLAALESMLEALLSEVKTLN